MINLRNLKLTSGAMAAAVSVTGLLALSGCEERPYPTAAKTSYEAPKAPPAQLAGAPATPPSYEAPRAPEPTYTPPAQTPPTYSAPAYQPRPYDPPAIVAMAPIPNPGEYGQEGYGRKGRRHGHYETAPAPQPTYDTGYQSEPVVTYGKPVHHPHKPAATYGAKPVTPPKAYTPPTKTYTPPAKPTYAAKPPVTPPPYKKPEPPKPTYAAKPPVAPPVYKKPEPPKPTYAAKTAPENTNQAHAPKVAPENTNMAHAKAAVKADAKAVADAAKTAADKAKAQAPVVAKAVDDKAKAAAAAAVVAADKAKAAAHDMKADVKTAAASAKPATPAPAPGANTADRSTRLATLQSALTDAISKGAVLKAPDRFTANQPADVTLTIPAGFADTLRSEAAKNGLTDAAASVNMTAVLSGDGFSVTPDETLSLPLTVGQPTEFKWTVTALPGAKGPLHADVGADLLGGGSDTLALGSVQKQAGLGIKFTPRVLGAGLLVLIAILLVAWLARGRGPSRPASARRASRAARGARPLDMESSEAH